MRRARKKLHFFLILLHSIGCLYLFFYFYSRIFQKLKYSPNPHIMRKFYYLLSFLVAMLWSFNSYAQEVVTLKFEAEHQDHSYQQLDSIMVTNLTQGWTEVLYYPDTILTMNTVGIHGWENEKGSVKLYQNVPNPFNGITDFRLTLLNKEKVDLVVFDINGKKVAEYHNTLPSGEHQFRATMNTPQTYLLSAVTKNGNTSIKMINLSNTGEQARIEYVSSMPLTVETTKKHTNNLFAQGDNMQYVGYATQIDGSKEAAVTQKQQGSGTVTFVFPNEEIPPYLIVRTDSAFNLTSSTATLSGSWKAHNMTVTEEGFNWRQANATEWNTLTCDHTDAEFTFGIRNLTKETQYVFKAYAVADEEYYYGEEVTFSTTGIVPPTVKTDSVTDIDYNRAHVYGSFAKGEESVKKIGFELRENAEWVNVRSFIGTQITSPFDYELFDLKQNTKYAVRAYAITESDTTYAEPKYFTTMAITPPVVKTLEATEVASVKALLHGTFTKTSEDVTACGFQYKKDGTDSWLAVAATLTPEFSALATSLTPSTKYVFRAYAQTASDLAYGEELSFTTVEYVMPSIEAGEVTDITNTSATVSAKQSNGAEIVERGFIYSLYPNRTLNSHATYQLIGTVKDGSTEDGVFQTTLSLIQGATYYVRGYAKTADMVLYTEDMKVVMPDPEGLVDCGTVTDADGNEYKTVRLGSNCWMRENLRTTKYADGTPIEFYDRPTMTKVSLEKAMYEPFIQNNDTMPAEVCGYYYGVGFINDDNAICPIGWRVSTMDDWCDLFNYVSETYADNAAVTCNTSGRGSVGNISLAYPLVIPHYFANYNMGKPQPTSNATGFGWFYAGSLNGNTTSSYPRCEGRYDAYWTSTKTGSNCLPFFIQNTGSNLQRYYESGCQLYGYFVRCVKEPDPVLGVVTTEPMSDVTYYSATAHGKIVSNGYTAVTERGFCWNNDTAPTVDNHKVVVEGTENEFSTVLNDLTHETTYYVRAYMINSVGISYGEEVSFTTLPLPVVPTVTTGEAHNIMKDQATIDGEVTSDGGEAVTARGICYATTPEPTIESTVIPSGEGLGSFSVEIKELVSGQTYYARAYATNKVGTAYGNEVTFAPLVEAQKPTVITQSVDNILDTKATVHCEVTENGGADVTERGICYSTTNAQPDLGDKSIKANDAGMGTYALVMDSLSFETTYYVRAYAVNEAGVGYGDALTFTTLEEIKEMLVRAGEVTGVTRTDATVSATLLYGVDVTERGFIYSLYPGRTLSSHATYQLIGTIKDESTENGEFSHTFTNLIQGGTYYVRGYAKTAEKEVYSEDMKVVMQDPEGLVDCGTMVDGDGNEYRTVVLGGNCWTRENLRTTKYADGTPITMFDRPTMTLISNEYAMYEPFIQSGDTMPAEVCGYYYGVGFVNDDKAVCPAGWRVSTMDDWCSLLNYVSETYANNTAVTCNTSGRGSVGSLSLAYPIVLPHYFASYNFGKPQATSNATGFGWFYAGSLNGNTSSSYPRCEGRYDAYWTSTKTGSNCLPWFFQSTGTTLQRYYESGCQRYGYFIRCVKEPEAQLGSVQTNPMTEISHNAATANARILSDGFAAVTERGFCWNTTGNPSIEDHKEVVDVTAYTYSFGMTGLTPETNYYVKAYMVNEIGMSYGEEVSFTTKPAPTIATVTTSEAYEIMTDNVKVDGNVSADGGAEVTARGICYATTAAPTVESKTVDCGKGTGIFTAALTGLEQGQTYYARAYAVNEVGTSYGNEITFKALAQAEKPMVHTLEVTGIIDVAAVVNCEVVSNGGSEIIERGVCYSTTNNQPDLSDKVVRAATAEVGTYQIELKDLSFETTYYVRAYATNEAGTAYGEALTFTTMEEFKEMAVEAGEVTGVTRTEATVSATLKYGQNVTERGFLYSLYKNATHKSHPTYVLIGSKQVEGTDNGEFSATFENLIQGAIYYVRGYAKSGDEYVYSNDMKVVMEDPEGLKDCGTITDGDGNEYRTVQLGKLCWTRENLHTSKYNDGSDISKFIPIASTIKVAEKIAEYTPSVVTYNGYADTLYGDMAGYFYGYGLRYDPNVDKICPEGWHIPSVDEFGELFTYINETYNDGSLAVKAYSSSGNVNICSNQDLYYPMVLPYYFSNNGFKNTSEKTNATGFGWFYFGELDGNTSQSHYRTTQAYYEGMWTSTGVGSYMNVFIQHNGTYLQYANQTGNQGYSRVIRCVKDAE